VEPESPFTYRTVAPAAALASRVECYWFLTGPADPGGAPERVLPDGCVEIVLNLADPLRQVQPGAAAEPRGTPVVAGQLERFIRLEASGRLDLVGIRFHPAGARPFLGVPIDELSERVARLDDLRPGLARTLLGPVAEARGPAARTRALDRALRDAPGAADPLVEAVAGEIVRTEGGARIGDLADRAGLSTRQLQRRFRAATGLGPKRLSRILRLHRVLRAVEGARGHASWARVAADCGYADQSHLIRDFREFAGETPPAFLAADEPLARCFSRVGRMSHSFKTGRLS
jgi:AraC-like DNA-binding protein